MYGNSCRRCHLLTFFVSATLLSRIAPAATGITPLAQDVVNRPDGGWPQRFPLQDDYGRHITFNDQAMIGVMDLLKDIVDGAPDFTFASDEVRKRAAEAFDRGIECILKCQIRLNGKLTAWCEQH